MNTYEFTRSRIFQWLGILLALGLIAVSYWYYRSQASTLNSPSTDPMSTGLAGYWALDEGTGTSATDSSTNGSTGTLTNSPTWTTGQIGGAVSFDGTNDYITITPTAAIKPQAQMTISAWVKRNASGETDYIFWERDSVVQEEGLFFYYGSDNKVHFVFRITGTGYTDVASTTTVTDTNWHLVTVTSGSSNATTFYIDGVNAGSGTTTTPNTGLTISSALLGARNGGGAPDFYGSITLDELRIYNRVLSPDEVAQLYRLSSPTGVDTNLKGYWSFNGDDISGTTAYDRSGSRNNGTLANGPVAIQGKIGQALDFDGTNDYVSTADYSYSNAQAFTMSVWFKADTVSGNQVIFSKETYEYNLRLTDATLAFVYWDTGGVGAIDLSYSNVTANRWYLISITYNGSGAAYMYVDGVRVSSDTNIVNAFQNKAEALRIGGGYHISGSPGYLNGKIDEMRIYNRALSEGEIQSLYTQGGGTKVDSTVSQPQGTGRLDSGLAGYWAMDDGSGTSATDSSTNANTGTLTGGPAWTTGQIGSAVDFDGTDDYVTVADADALDVADSTHFTLTGWFNRDTFTADHTIIAKRNGQAAGDTGYVLYVDDANDDIVFEVSDGTDEYSRTSTSSFTSSGWQHVAAVFDDTLGMTIYINGTVNQDAASGTLGNIGSLANTVAFRSGAESDAGSPFDGKLDEIRLYNRVLSPDEVNQLYRLTAPTSVDATLDAYWSFDGHTISGTTLYDQSGRSKNGTLMNGVQITEGKIGQALLFDGVDDRVNVTSVTTGTTFTITAWVMPRPGGPSYGHIFGVNQNTCFEYHNANNKLTYNHSGGYNDSNTALVDNEWNFVGMVVTAGNGVFYLDGNPDGTKTGIGTANFAEIGWNTGGEYFNGKIDELRFYGRALSAAEMKALYTQGVSSSINSGNSQPEGGNSPDGGLAGYWALDDGSGTTATDSSTNGNTGTLTNGPTWTTGQMNGAVDFDGTDDYITIADADSLDIPDSRSFTLSGWFNRDTYAADHTILAKANGQTATDTGYIVYIDDATDQLIFNASDGTDRYQLASTSTFASSSWRHFAVVWTEGSTSLTELYVDGFRQAATATGTQANVNSLANSNALRIGAESDNGNPFDGKLDEIRIYGRAFTRAGVLDLFRTTSPTGTDTSLKGYWSFNGKDVSGTAAYDRSGAGNNGTLTNGPATTEGKVGQGLNFDGVDDYVTVADADSLDFTTAMTLSLWVKADNWTGESGYASLVKKDKNYIIRKDTFSGSTLRMYWWDGSNVRYVAVSTLPSTGDWHHIVGIISGNDISALYIDGVSSAGAAATYAADSRVLTNVLEIGSGVSGSESFDGVIDEVRIYNRALSASEVQALYNQSR